MTMCSSPQEFKQELENIKGPIELYKVKLVDDPEKNQNHYLYMADGSNKTVIIDSPTDYSGTGGRYYRKMEKIFIELRGMESVTNVEVHSMPGHLYRRLKNAFFHLNASDLRYEFLGEEESER